MNNYAKLFCGAALMSLIASCSNEDSIPGGEPKDSEGKFYATLTLQLPQSRSATLDNPTEDTNSDAGFEIGQDAENNVGSVLVVLATRNESGDYAYLASSVADAVVASNPAANRIAYNVKFQNAQLLLNPEALVYVFAYCNPTETLKGEIMTLFPKGTGVISNEFTDAIWSSNTFLMTNRDISQATLPTAVEFETVYNTEANPYDLGTVTVERVVSRFDFKDYVAGTDVPKNTYEIKEPATGDVKATIELTDMALINLAKEYYYLPWINYGNVGVMDGAELCGRESLKSWVVSPNTDFKQNPVFNKESMDALYYFSTGYPEAGFDFTTIPNFTAISSLKVEDDDNNWDGADGFDKTGYHIWRYATENTLPNVDDQIHALSTGVVFRGELKAKDEASELGQAMSAGKVLYALNGTLYGDKTMVENYIANQPTSVLADAWKLATSVQGNVDDNGDLKSNGRTNLAIYRAIDGKYFLYYPYYNRHNDNGNNTVMGQMEFASVRNNIYKLAVTEIMKYGHPGNPGDDPDPEKPEDPDESPETYFTVKVQVVPWVVRINNIIL